jgi:CheY-like chemotaxis protein
MTSPETAILAVEDDDIVRRQMVRLLQVDGFTVFQAACGEEAVALLDREDIDLVLTDWKMPGMDGVSLLKYVRAHHPDVPVALVTAYPEDLEQFKPDGILVKPFSAKQLRSLIRDLTRLRA